MWVNFYYFVVLHKNWWMSIFVFYLREIDNDSVLEGLKVRSHLTAYWEILSKSLLRYAAAHGDDIFNNDEETSIICK